MLICPLMCSPCLRSRDLIGSIQLLGSFLLVFSVEEILSLLSQLLLFLIFLFWGKIVSGIVAPKGGSHEIWLASDFQRDAVSGVDRFDRSMDADSTEVSSTKID